MRGRRRRRHNSLWGWAGGARARGLFDDEATRGQRRAASGPRRDTRLRGRCLLLMCCGGGGGERGTNGLHPGRRARALCRGIDAPSPRLDDSRRGLDPPAESGGRGPRRGGRGAASDGRRRRRCSRTWPRASPSSALPHHTTHAVAETSRRKHHRQVPPTSPSPLLLSSPRRATENRRLSGGALSLSSAPARAPAPLDSRPPAAARPPDSAITRGVVCAVTPLPKGSPEQRARPQGWQRCVLFRFFCAREGRLRLLSVAFGRARARTASLSPCLVPAPARQPGVATSSGADARARRAAAAGGRVLARSAPPLLALAAACLLTPSRPRLTTLHTAPQQKPTTARAPVGRAAARRHGGPRRERAHGEATRPNAPARQAARAPCPASPPCPLRPPHALPSPPKTPTTPLPPKRPRSSAPSPSPTSSSPPLAQKAWTRSSSPWAAGRRSS
jgi:hypothetical protein